MKEQKIYRCKVCGYQYNPEEGDPLVDVPPGTAFEDLPPGWNCPICAAGCDDFEEVE